MSWDLPSRFHVTTPNNGIIFKQTYWKHCLDTIVWIRISDIKPLSFNYKLNDNDIISYAQFQYNSNNYYILYSGETLLTNNNIEQALIKFKRTETYNVFPLDNYNDIIIKHYLKGYIFYYDMVI